MCVTDFGGEFVQLFTSYDSQPTQSEFLKDLSFNLLVRHVCRGGAPADTPGNAWKQPGANKVGANFIFPHM